MKSRILIVDDNPANLKLAREVLEADGYAVQCAKDAESALTRIRTDPPELILLDLQLPVMDGLTLARLIKGNESTRKIRVVAVTAFAMNSDQELAWEAGCDGFIAKPIDVAEFPGQVAAYLKA